MLRVDMESLSQLSRGNERPSNITLPLPILSPEITLVLSTDDRVSNISYWNDEKG